MKKQQSKGKIVSGLIFSPQAYLEKATGNLFMKGKKTDLDEIYDKFCVDYDLINQIMVKDIDENGKSYVRWGSQKVA